MVIASIVMLMAIIVPAYAMTSQECSEWARPYYLGMIEAREQNAVCMEELASCNNTLNETNATLQRVMHRHSGGAISSEGQKYQQMYDNLLNSGSNCPKPVICDTCLKPTLCPTQSCNTIDIETTLDKGEYMKVEDTKILLNNIRTTHGIKIAIINNVEIQEGEIHTFGNVKVKVDDIKSSTVDLDIAIKDCTQTQ